MTPTGPEQGIQLGQKRLLIHLPPELLSALVECLSQEDVYSPCLTNRLLHEFAILELYRVHHRAQDRPRIIQGSKPRGGVLTSAAEVGRDVVRRLRKGQARERSEIVSIIYVCLLHLYCLNNRNPTHTLFR